MSGFSQIPNPGALVPTSDSEKLVKSLLPEFTDTRKTDYLVLRACSFLTDEALTALRIPYHVYAGWKETDKTFVEFEGIALRQIQGHLARETLRAKFFRNAYLMLTIDDEVLTQRAFAKDTMDGEDRADAREALKRYSAPNIAALAKLLGDTHDEDPKNDDKPQPVEFYVPIGLPEYEAEALRRAQAQALLTQFTETQEQIIDGEVIDSSSS